MKRLLLFLATIPFLTQCASDSHSGANTKILPTLSSPARAQAWGAPSVIKSATGYITSYVNPSEPTEKLRIIASSQTMPFFVYPPNVTGTKIVNGVPTQVSEAQIWSKPPILDKRAKMYQSTFPTATKAANFATLGMPLRDQAGNSGQYRIEAEGTKTQVQIWLSELRFTQ